jgi:hypothetical protein
MRFPSSVVVTEPAVVCFSSRSRRPLSRRRPHPSRSGTSVPCSVGPLLLPSYYGVLLWPCWSRPRRNHLIWIGNCRHQPRRRAAPRRSSSTSASARGRARWPPPRAAAATTSRPCRNATAAARPDARPPPRMAPPRMGDRRLARPRSSRWFTQRRRCCTRRRSWPPTPPWRLDLDHAVCVARLPHKEQKTQITVQWVNQICTSLCQLMEPH